MKEEIKGAIIGGLVTLAISIIGWVFTLGLYSEKITNLSNQMNSLQASNKNLELGLNLTSNILVRILNYTKIPEAEKIAINNDITNTIKEFSSARLYITSSSPHSDPIYLERFKTWSSVTKETIE
ncbi:MAG: hypothetical protein Q8M40_10860 [Legionella sp.]|nr:hypothetical protein [Legionella sp.]